MGRVAPTVTVELDKPRTLKLTLNGMIQFEKQTGKRFHQLNADLSFEEMRALVWACLIHEDPALTPEQVGELLDTGNLYEVVEAVGKLMAELQNQGTKDGSPQNRPTG